MNKCNSSIGRAMLRNGEFLVQLQIAFLQVKPCFCHQVFNKKGNMILYSLMFHNLIQEQVIKKVLVERYNIDKSKELKRVDKLKIPKATKNEISNLIKWKYDHLISEIINK